MCLFCERRDDTDAEKDKPLSYSEALERAYEFNFRFNNNTVNEDVKTIEESLVALPPANQSNKSPRSPRKRINKKKRFPSIIKNVSSLEEIKEDELFEVSESSETSSEEEKENDKRDLAAIHRERALNSGAFIPNMNEGRSRHHHHHRKDKKHSRKKEKG